MKLAVSLLKDKNGVIDLDLPMNGSIDDPKFRIGPIIWKVFVNLIVKAATAPFALLGHLFGGGEHVNIIEFAPGSAVAREAGAGPAGLDRQGPEGAPAAQARRADRLFDDHRPAIPGAEQLHQ